MAQPLSRASEVLEVPELRGLIMTLSPNNTLLSMMRVCKAWCKQATEMLYSSIDCQTALKLGRSTVSDR